MSAAAGGGIDRTALARLIADSGVRLTAEEADAVARSLDRMQNAAATLLQSLSFDETAERFYRLLETDPPTGPAGE
jgi:hypothetical protein